MLKIEEYLQKRAIAEVPALSNVEVWEKRAYKECKK